ncbi:hypothetical protein Ocin01_05266 [Orchesella cincta]|uniref:Uncharacterized protein n=1 Tax=Orchesella cincta TaxID=48709 RepID=A0A1D2N856_ORCCI|nr:hypothetical protein Ocin01_05266 [Orchesella cincta]
MYKFAVLVAFAALLAVATAQYGYGHYDNGLGYGAYSLYNGGATYGIGSYGGHGTHGHGGYRGALPYGGMAMVGTLVKRPSTKPVRN